MDIICLDSTDSTNNWVAQNEDKLPSPSMVRCHSQIAGRGQRGNTWESEPGKNFTGTVLFHPLTFPATSQFLISEAIALAVVNTLAFFGIRAKVKWPNDVYVGDRKICGILVEHVIMGNVISRTLAGIGINVNQKIFISDAPNPTSMALEKNREYDIDNVAEILADKILENLYEINALNPGKDREKYFDYGKNINSKIIHEKFLSHLWRKDGSFHHFIDKKRDEIINAQIENVVPDGILYLRTELGDLREFAFKEVEFVL